MFASCRYLSAAFVILFVAGPVYADEAEDRSMRYVEKLGGEVYTLPSKPAWRVRLNRTAVTDEGLKNLSGFKHLEDLWLRHTQVTDEGLKNLAALDLLSGAQIRSRFLKLQSGLGKERLDQVRFLS